jgi:hypothetical protein
MERITAILAYGTVNIGQRKNPPSMNKCRPRRTYSQRKPARGEGTGYSSTLGTVQLHKACAGATRWYYVVV